MTRLRARRWSLVAVPAVAAIALVTAVMLIRDDSPQPAVSPQVIDQESQAEQRAVSQSASPDVGRERAVEQEAGDTPVRNGQSIEQQGMDFDQDSDHERLSCAVGGATLFYSQSETGSASQAEFSACLNSAAQRGELVALEAQLLEDGVLMQMGESSMLWSLGRLDEHDLSIVIDDERIVFEDRCDGRFEYASGRLTIADWGYCRDIDLTTEPVTRPDFVIYFVGQRFVADGEDGWYAISFDRPRIDLSASPSGVMITAEEDFHPPSGYTFKIRRPLAGNDRDLQDYYASDWITRVWSSLISFSFSEAAYEFFPDSEAYWSVIKAWIGAILDDLFLDRVDQPELNLIATERGLMFFDESTYFATQGDAFDTLNEVARVVANEPVGYSPTLTATLLMLWDRYVPAFDWDEAAYAAERHRVAIGEPVEVNATTERTAAVFDVLRQRAPEAPSDHLPIDPEELHRSVVLQVGREDWVVVVSSDISPGCGAQYDSDGSFSGWYMNPIGEFTVNAGGFWNGLRLSHFSSDRTGEGGMLVTGTPTVPGRVRVRVLTRCDVEDGEEPILLGYSEIIVVDANDE